MCRGARPMLVFVVIFTNCGVVVHISPPRPCLPFSGGDTILFALMYMFVDKVMFRRVSVIALCAHHGGSMLGSGIGQAMVEGGGEPPPFLPVVRICPLL